MLLHFNDVLRQLLINFGPAAAFAVIFTESFFLFFLPGDSFIFMAGLLAAQNYFHISSLVAYMILAAFFGNMVGYLVGKYLGVRLFHPKSRLFKPEGLEKTKTFYHKYGPLALVIGRFTPFVRTFVPILAGSAEMGYPLFLFYSFFGALLWVFGVGFAGYYLGRTIPNIDHYILPIIVGIVAVSLIGPATAYFKSRRKRK